MRSDKATRNNKVMRNKKRKLMDMADVIVVTGGGSGMGLEVAKLAGKDGLSSSAAEQWRSSKML